MLTHVKGGRSVIEDLLSYNEEFVNIRIGVWLSLPVWIRG